MDIKELNSVHELNKRLGVETLHPLITLLDFSKIDVSDRSEVVVNEYFTTGMQREHGLPTVKYCAEHLSLSANYLGDLIKRDTGHSAQEYLQQTIVERAKVSLITTTLSVSEISYSLGFEYPHYFSRLFKKRVGVSPKEYRTMN
ncbi:MAG: helix-turn-helix transcriptional regulator [Bacteroidales bacterium]